MKSPWQRPQRYNMLFLGLFYIPYLTHQLSQFVPVNFHRNVIRLLYVVSPLQGSDIIISWTPGFVSRAQAPSHTPGAGARPVGGELSPLRGSSLCYVCFITRKTPLQGDFCSLYCLHLGFHVSSRALPSLALHPRLNSSLRDE